MAKPGKRSKDETTGSERREQQFLEISENQRLLLQSSPVAILITRLDGMIVYANQRFTNQFGLDVNDKGMNVANFYENPKDRQNVLEKVRLQGHLDDYELRIRKVNSEPGWALVSANLFEFGGEMALLSSLIDITERKRVEEELRESNTLATIARTLSETEHVGLRSVLQLIVTSVKGLIPGAEETVIHIMDEEQQVLVPEAVSGFDSPAKGALNMKLGIGVAGQVLASGKAINITDTQTDARYLSTGEIPAYRSLIVAPVQSGSQKLGTISVQNHSPNAFSQEESQLLSALGTQAANACLLEITKKSLKETNALYRISQGLVASVDPEHLMNDIVELLQKNFGYYYVQIFVADPDTGDFVVRAGSGKIGRQLKSQGYRLAAGESIVGYTAETGMPFFTNNVDEVVSFIRPPLLDDIKSELAIPIKIGDQFLGLLDIHQAPPASLTQRDVQLVSAVADQLAVALQKANLYTDLQNSLRQEQATRSQLIHSERLAVAGRLLASVSHELNNPLQAIQNALFLLKEERGISIQGKQDLEIVLSETERMATLLERLRTTYRPVSTEDVQPVQINNVINNVYALVATHLRHNQISYEFDPDPDLPLIPGMVDQLRQVILNLFMNAVDAMTDGGCLTVSTRFLAENREIFIAITDTGSGINPSILPNIFDAFVTNKERGTGLGLTISYEIVLKHHGRIQAINNPKRGATFSVWLPVDNGGNT
jgi:PAS domain S-box-containing protein